MSNERRRPVGWPLTGVVRHYGLRPKPRFPPVVRHASVRACWCCGADALGPVRRPSGCASSDGRCASRCSLAQGHPRKHSRIFVEHAERVRARSSGERSSCLPVEPASSMFSRISPFRCRGDSAWAERGSSSRSGRRSPVAPDVRRRRQSTCGGRAAEHEDGVGPVRGGRQERSRRRRGSVGAHGQPPWLRGWATPRCAGSRAVGAILLGRIGGATVGGRRPDRGGHHQVPRRRDLPVLRPNDLETPDPRSRPRRRPGAARPRRRDHTASCSTTPTPPPLIRSGVVESRPNWRPDPDYLRRRSRPTVPACDSAPFEIHPAKAG